MAATNQEHIKETLRAEYLQKRKALGKDELERLNSGLREQATRLKPDRLGNIRTVHIFMSIQSMGEPDTRSLATLLDDLLPGPIRWVTGKTERKTTGMYHFVWDKDTLIRANRWGIPEPLGGYRVDEAEIDLILVPLLAFDQQGHRVGYGKGYYDRFLAKCRPDALKVGVSLFEPVKSIADTHQADIALNGCITPEKTYWFGR